MNKNNITTVEKKVGMGASDYVAHMQKELNQIRFDLDQDKNKNKDILQEEINKNLLECESSQYTSSLAESEILALKIG